MFKADAGLFLTASTGVNIAKQLVDQMADLLEQIAVDMPESDAFKNCRRIESYELDYFTGLEGMINSKKDWLFRNDVEFAKSYRDAVDEINTSFKDVSNGSDLLTSSLERESTYAEYYALRRNEDNLDENGINMLDSLECKIRQYEFENDMYSLDFNDAEDQIKYDKIFEQWYGYGRHAIEWNPDLTEEQKKEELDKFEKEATNRKKALELKYSIFLASESLAETEPGSRSYYLCQERYYERLIEYYDLFGGLNETQRSEYSKRRNLAHLCYMQATFPHQPHYEEPIIKLRIELGEATEDEKEYLDMSEGEKWLHRSYAFTNSFIIEGIFGGVVEPILKGGLTRTTGFVGIIYDPAAEWTEATVTADWSGEVYYGLTLAVDANQVIAYGDYYVAGALLGESFGTLLLSLAGAPGAANMFMATLFGLKGIGSTAEEVMASDVGCYWQALVASYLAGATEGVTAYFLYAKNADGKSLYSLDSSWKVTIALGKEVVNSGVTESFNEDGFDFETFWHNILTTMMVQVIYEYIVNASLKDTQKNAEASIASKKAAVEASNKNLSEKMSDLVKSATVYADDALSNNPTLSEKIANLGRAIMNRDANAITLYEELMSDEVFIGMLKKCGKEFVEQNIGAIDDFSKVQ